MANAHITKNEIQGKVAVVLLQLGGPTSLDSVEPFLFNLFSDPDIFELPAGRLYQKALARFIASRRAPRVQQSYKLIGGKSPINELTDQQAFSLEQAFSEFGYDIRVFTAMRYWHPTTEDVILHLKKESYEHVVLLPLYPQFSRATTFSSFNEWNRQARKNAFQAHIQRICCYPQHPLLIDAFVDRIQTTLDKIRRPYSDLHLIFSAHGVPVSFIKRGDPYQLQVEATVQAVVERGKWNIPYTLCYQSKVGPLRWLQPSLIETVDTLVAANHRHLIVVPIAFVSEHIETLYEINIEVHQHAMKKGCETFELVPAINSHPSFIECLADLVLTSLRTSDHPRYCETLWHKHPQHKQPVLCPHLSHNF